MQRNQIRQLLISHLFQLFQSYIAGVYTGGIGMNFSHLEENRIFIFVLSER